MLPFPNSCINMSTYEYSTCAEITSTLNQSFLKNDVSVKMD